MRTKLLLVALAASIAPVRLPSAAEQHLLYVANPGTRNYTEYGGVGISVFDIDKGYKFVRRIPTWDVPEGKEPENVKGIAASAKTGRVYVTSLNRMIAIDAVSGKRIWDKTYEGGCDRMAISPDGKMLYVPQLEGPSWHAVNAANGEVIATVETEVRLPQHHLLGGRRARVHGRPEIAAALDRGHQHAQGREDRRTVR